MELVAQGLVRAETENDGEVRSADSFDLLDDLYREEVAVYAVVVDTVVGNRGQELHDQVAVGPVYLDRVKACHFGPSGSLPEIFDILVHFLGRQRPGSEFCGDGFAVDTADLAGADGLFDPGLHARVDQLQDRAGAVVLDRVGDPGKARHELVIADIYRAGDLKAGLIDVGSFDRDHAGAASGSGRIVLHELIRDFTVRSCEQRRHGGHIDAVLHCHTADLDRFQDIGIVCAHLLPS